MNLAFVGYIKNYADLGEYYSPRLITLSSICTVLHILLSLIHQLLNIFWLPIKLGLCTEIKESYSNALSSVSGCGLGFVGLVMEAMSDGGVRTGLPRALSTELVTQTLIGAARLVQETGKHPAQVVKSSIGLNYKQRTLHGRVEI